MNLLLKRAEMYDQLVKLNTQYPGDKMTPSVAREFSKMCDSLDEINARISFQELEEKVLNANENLKLQVQFEKLFSKIFIYDTGHKLIRLGVEKDGGYLVPDILDEIKYLF